MITLTANLLNGLTIATGDDSIARNRSILFELYPTDTYPNATTGLFDPSTATARWAKHDCVWLANSYDGRVVSHSELSEHMSGEFNSITLTIENADRYLSQFNSSNVIDGMRLVVRYVNWDYSTVLADSRQWVMRLQAPDNSELDREQGQLTAREELASLDIQIPKRKVTGEDSNGRSPNDVLFDGFVFASRPSSVKYVDTQYARHLLIFLKKKEIVKYNQWSSQTGSEEASLQLGGGRVQMEGLPVFNVDIGFYIIGIWVFAGTKVSFITDFQLPDPNYLFYGIWGSETLRQSHVHLGDPGGTGTNSAPDTIENNYPQNTWIGSQTAYVGFAVAGPESLTQPFANPQMDPTPTLVAIVGFQMELPDGGGIFNQVGWSDSPVYFVRHVLTSPDYFGLDTRLVNDSKLPAVHAERQRPIIDKSNGEFLALMDHDLSALANGNLIRVNSTGLLSPRYFRHILDGTQPDPLVANRDDIFGVSVGGEIGVGGDQQLTNGVTLAGQSVGPSSWKYYYIDVPAGTTQLQVILTGSGDGTTFVRQGSKPTLTAYTAYAYTASPQTVTITNPTSGRWWVGIAGFQVPTAPAAGLNYSLLAVVTNGMTGNVLPLSRVVRKAYTTNITVTDTVNASDFLNTALATGRLYRVTDFAGRQDIRAKKASDSSYLIAAASAGATQVSVANVEPWIASLQGYLLINVGLTTSEYRKITLAQYDPTTGNTITLAVSGTGLTASGATLTGGTTGASSSGSVTVSGASGAMTITVWGIPINYTLATHDNDNSVAGIFTALINADPNLRQYVRAVWNNDNIVHIYSTVGKLSFGSALVNNQPAQVSSPITAPTATTTTSGTLTPGDYYLGYTLVDGSGDETTMSPLRKITIASGQKVSVSSLGTLPSGTSSANWYFSPAVNDDLVQFFINNAGGAFTINAVADHDADFPPEVNTTGGETIRVMEVFTQYNTRASSFKWIPSASKINQVTGTFIDAANGFKRTPITVNDRAHQRAIKQINKQEINLSGVDNFSQASRLCYAALAEARDGGAGAKWATDDAGIPLEVGDVVAVNDYWFDGTNVVPYLVNEPIIITDVTLGEDFDVSFEGKVYSTALLEGLTGRKPVIISTTLKYLTDPPPIALNLTISQAENFFTGLLVDFDFDQWAHAQMAHVFMKGPSFATPAVEPSDSTYKLMDTVYPDGNNRGHLEIRATSAGTYWIKVETQSVFGQSAASGHPVVSFLLRPPAPINLSLLKLANGDRALTWQPAVVGAYEPETYIVRVKDSSGVTLKRTVTVTVGDHALPVNWAYSLGSGDQSKVTISGDGSLTATTPTGTQVQYDSQTFYGNGTVEFDVDDRFFDSIQVINGSTTNQVGNVTNSYFRGTGTTRFLDADVTTATQRRLLANTRLSFHITNGALDYLYNDVFWAHAGWSVAVAPTFFLRASILSDPADPPTNEPQAFLRVRFFPDLPEQFVYSDATAKADFGGSNPSTVKMEVTQISGSGIESLAATVTG